VYSLQERNTRSARKSLSTGSAEESSCDDKNWAEAREEVFLPALAQGAAESETRLTRPSQASARTRLAYGLLKAAMDGAVKTIESNHALLGAGWWGLQAHTVESVHASALAAIELIEALNRAAVTKGMAAAQFAHSQRQRDAIDRQIIEFLAAARNMIAVLTEPPSDPPVDCSKAGKCPAAPCKPQSVAERLKTLTQRQRRVLELMADGLPNKLIAYELGLCETTVKAHVSEVLRKLCVYNRTRAIVLLANIDLTSIFLPDADSKSLKR